MSSYISRLKAGRRVFTVSVIALLMLPLNLMAQGTGRIVGVVVESGSGSPLPGANIIVEGTSKGAATDVNGRFMITNMAAGSYSITASYLGFSDAISDVVVVAGETAESTFELQQAVLEGQNVDVMGKLTLGQAKSLHEQKNAANIKNVVSSEVFSRFPDQNAAESVQRIPSISITTDQGEGEMIQVRGIPQEWNAVQLNGIRIPSPDPDDGSRAVGLDLVQSNLMESISVTKALTPDMDGDALGGTVDFHLKSAPEQATYKLTVGAGYNQQESVWNEWGNGVTELSGLAARRFLDNKLGILVTGSYYKTDRGSILQEYTYTDEDGTTVAKNKFNDYDVNRVRFGGTLAGDYRLSQDHTLGFMVNYNAYLDKEIRRSTEFAVEDLEEARITRNRLEDQRLQVIKVNGDHLFGNIEVDWDAFTIDASENMPNRSYWTFERDNPYTGLSNDQLLALTGESTFPALDPLDMKRLRYDNNYNEDKNVGGSFNATLPITFMGQAATVKAGLKLRAKSRYYERHRYNAKDEDDILQPDDSWPYIEYYFDDPFVATLPLSEFKEDERKLKDNYDASETVTAAYLMTNLNISHKLSALAGARLEATATSYEHWSVTGPGEGSYTNLLPSLHLTYKLDPATNIRFALTTGLARPSYTALIPYEYIDEEDREISRGNPDLEPMNATGVDLMYEKFTPGLGLISAGFFAKKLTKPLARSATIETIDGVDYEVTMPINGDGTASIYGIELALNQRLDFLGIDFLNPFSIYTNYTYTKSESEFGDRKMPLNMNPAHIANLAILYDNPATGTSFAITNVWRAAVIKSVGSNEKTDTWFDKEYHLSFSANQRITGNISAFVTANNLTNQAEHEMLGDPTTDLTRLQQTETYGMWFNGGIKFEF